MTLTHWAAESIALLPVADANTRSPQCPSQVLLVDCRRDHGSTAAIRSNPELQHTHCSVSLIALTCEKVHDEHLGSHDNDSSVTYDGRKDSTWLTYSSSMTTRSSAAVWLTCSRRTPSSRLSARPAPCPR